MQRTDFNHAYSLVKHPSKVTIAAVRDSKGKNNLITLEWFMKTSIVPPMLAISIGHTRYSYECLQAERYFNLCFPSPEMIELIRLSGSQSGRDIDKLAHTEEPWFEGRLAKLPVLKNAAACFECQVVSQVKSGDHTIYVGEVKHSWSNENKNVFLSVDL
jgi:flavin reductase (DIM6/NTAB) family NADH-FMN oxidoreductase RutF